MTTSQPESARQRFLEEALVYVYIAQYVRPDGPQRAGVVVSDCQKYNTQLRELVALGDVEQMPGTKTSAYLEGFVTSTKGTEAASKIVEQRLRANADKIEKEFSKAPPRMLRYLFGEVFDSGGSDWGRFTTLDREVGIGDSISPHSPNPSYHCMLAEREVADARDRLFRLFSTAEVLVVATSYSIVQKNPMRQLCYVPASELQHIWQGHLEERGLRGHLWPLELEEMHTVFHRLDSRGNPFLLGREELERSIPVFYRDAANGFLDECLSRNVLVASTLNNGDPCLQIQDKLWYDTARAERFKNPLLDFLLERVTAPAPEPAPGPVPPSPTERPDELIKQPESLLKENDLLLGDEVSYGDLRIVAQKSNLSEDQRREQLTAQGVLIYPLSTATTHTAIFGTNGSGKSVTTKRLIGEFVTHGVPVMVIDWHDEYVGLLRDLGGVVAVPPTATNKPGAGEVPFTWNVLDHRFHSAELSPEIIEDYIGIVVDLLSDKNLMDLSEPMKGGLTDALKIAYERLSTPTFRDVMPLISEIPIPPSTADALQRRVRRFSSGSLGSIFCGETSFEPAETFGRPMVVRVKDLTVDHQSAVGLLTFFLLRQAISHFKRLGEVSLDSPVRHVIVIDEAPMVIGSNPKVEREVVRMLQEVRKFGEGLVLVCRNPGISDDILRETNQKISHKLDVPRDVAAVGSMLGLDSKDRELLRRLPRGVAFARIAGNPTALVRIKST